MSENTQAKINVSVNGFSIEVSGSEEFVEKRFDSLEKLIDKHLSERTIVSPLQTAKNTDKEMKVKPTVSEDGLEDIYAFKDNNVHVLVDTLPGKGKAEKTVNAALLLLYGNKHYKQTESISSKEIGAFCKKHACFDSANFASTMKKSSSLFIVKDKEVTLTAPGAKAAEKLIETIHAPTVV